MAGNNNDYACQDWNASDVAGGTSIVNFYDGESVFVTGGTGFVGKALIEKLLRSCPGLKTIFLLIRPKRGKDIQLRFQELLENPVSKRARAVTGYNDYYLTMKPLNTEHCRSLTFCPLFRGVHFSEEEISILFK
jgi:hypothetical protein